jgi:abortive infection bacteriophage resistance protein
MHVDWSTLKEIAATQAIDVWYLFPLAGFYRQMPKLHSKLDQQKRQALIRLFGTTSWEDVTRKWLDFVTVGHPLLSKGNRLHNAVLHAPPTNSSPPPFRA